MGRKLNLQHLSNEECEAILKVIQKDFELRQAEKQRLAKVEDNLDTEVQKTVILTQQETFNDKCCIRCCRPFGYIFNRQQTCLSCLFHVCKNCSEYRDSEKGYLCHVCLQSKDLEKQSCDWFYDNVQHKFKRFGSAKVVRSLYKRKSVNKKSKNSLTETDGVGLESLLTSGRAIKTRPALYGVFTHINSACSGEELNLKNDSVLSRPPLPSPQAFSTPLPGTYHDNPFNGEDSISPLKTKDIYKENFEVVQKREDEESEKFRQKFESAWLELERALDNQTPSDVDYNDVRYGDFVSNYRNQFKDLLSNLSGSLQKIHNRSNEKAGKSSSQIRQTLSQVVENAVGDSVDWGSDEAISEISSSTDNSGAVDTSYEDQLAQAIITKLVNKHRRAAEDKQKQKQKEKESQQEDELEKAKRKQQELKDRKEKLRLEEEMESEEENKRLKEAEEDKNKFDYDEEFEKLIKFSQGTRSRPKPKPRKLEEKPIPVQEIPIVKLTHVKDESGPGLIERVQSLNKLHDTRVKLPDLSVSSLGFNEVDPDLMSLSQSEWEDHDGQEDSESSSHLTKRSWQDNWILGNEKGVPRSLRSTAIKRVKSDLSDSMFVHVPEKFVSPRVGETDAEDLSDLSENEDKVVDSQSDNSDGENAYYAQTSTEIERVLKRVERTSSVTDSFLQTDDSDLDASKSSSHYRAMKSGQKSGDPSLHLRLSESLDTSIQSDDSSPSSSQNRKQELKSSPKFQEMLIPSENDDPKFDFPPESTSSPEGEAIKMVCRVSGTEPIDVFWYRVVNDELQALEDDERTDINSDGNRNTLVLYNPSLGHSGQYMCVGISDVGRTSQYFVVTVKENPQDFKAPEFLRTIEDVEVTEGQGVKLRCKVKGYPPPRVNWCKDGQRISKTDKDYKIEKFGNRDFILSIEYVTLEHDAEYTVKAVNLGGECRQSAQIIVAEEAIEIKKNIKVQRSAVTVSTSNQIHGNKSGLTNQRKEDQQIANLSEKMRMTEDGVSVVAEDMLSTANELSFIHAELDAMNRALTDMEAGLSNHDDTVANKNLTNLECCVGDTFSHQVIDDYNNMKKSAGSVRTVTMAAANLIGSAEEVIEEEKQQGVFLERKSLRDAYVKPDYGHQLTVDVKMRGVDREESKSSIDSGVFSVPGDVLSSQRNGPDMRHEPMSDDQEQSTASHQPSNRSFDQPKHFQSKTDHYSRPNSITELTSSASRQSFDRSNNNANDFDSLEGEEIKFGLQPVDRKYRRDYVINDGENKKTKWEVNLNSYSPRAEVVNRVVDNTEDKIYMTAGKMFSLEEKVGDLEAKVRQTEGSHSDHLSDLEEEVARTVAQVHSSEQQVHHVETVVAGLKQNVPAEDHHRGVVSQSTLDCCHPADDSITEVDPQYQLPSVNRLKNMFSESEIDKDSAFRRDSNLKTVHSITARSFNKQRLAELREKVAPSDEAKVSTVDAPLTDPEVLFTQHTEDIARNGSSTKKYRAPEPPKSSEISAERATTVKSIEERTVLKSAQTQPITQSDAPAAQRDGRKVNPVLNRVAFWNRRLENEIVSDECVADEIQNLLPEYS